MSDRTVLEDRLESVVCPIERRKLMNCIAQRKHRLKLKEQKASGAAKNQQENRNVNRSSKKIIALPPQQQQMSAQKEQDIARFQQTDSMSAARTESTLTQKSLATVSIESSTAFEWTSPFESGYALLKGHA